MSDYNLPPGVTARDIDRAAGAYEKECDRCGDTHEARDLDEVGLCEDCAIAARLERDYERRDLDDCGPDCACLSCLIEARHGDQPFSG